MPLNVRFAPLPDVPKRKKRYQLPLGVAARSELMRRQRDNSSVEPDYNSEDDQGYYSTSTVIDDMQDNEPMEDPLIALGKVVRSASRGIWKKVSAKRKIIESEKSEQGQEQSVAVVMVEAHAEVENLTGNIDTAPMRLTRASTSPIKGSRTVSSVTTPTSPRRGYGSNGSQ